MTSAGMPSEADERLRGQLPLGLLILYEYTQVGGSWLVAGQYAVRSNTLFALEKRGLARMRLSSYGFGHNVRGSRPITSFWEAQITQAGVDWIEQHPAE